MEPLQNFASLIKDTLHWIPCNARRIKIWMDKILGHPLLASFSNIEGIRNWMHKNNLLTLHDISYWDCSCSWKSWKPLHPPQHLKQEYAIFLSHMHEKYPLIIELRTTEGGVVTTSTLLKGYMTLQTNTALSSTKIWNKVWNVDVKNLG